MRILITGATGWVGFSLVRSLVEEGHDLVLLVRNSKRVEGRFSFPLEMYDWNPDLGAYPPSESLRDLDGVIHLMGEPIAEGRWTPEKKDKIYRSRVESSRLLREAILQHTSYPEFMISASAVGIYQDPKNLNQREVDEYSPTGDEESSFLAKVCTAWERETHLLVPGVIRSAVLRFGVILGPDGGMLRTMLPFFQTGLVGPFGSGKDALNWVHLDDVISAVKFVMNDENLWGPINVVAPGVVTQEEFAKTMARVLRKPAIFRVPEKFLKLALGEKTEILLGAPRVVGRKLKEAGFHFEYEKLEDALADLVGEER